MTSRAEWESLVALDQRLAALELAAAMLAPAYDAENFWRRWNQISRRLDEIADAWPYHRRDAAYDYLLKVFEDAADRRGATEGLPA